MDNQNNTDITNGTSNIQEEIEKKISYARRAIAGNIPMVSPHAAVSSLKAAIEMGSSEAKAFWPDTITMPRAKTGTMRKPSGSRRNPRKKAIPRD